MSYTREQWATALLAELGNTNPSPYTLNWLVCWTQFETAWPNSASFNLLNTTQPEGGSTGGGSQGNIQYYSSFQNGITGNAVTLKNGNYPTLATALQMNDENTLRAAAQTNISNELGTWGTGHAGSIASCADSGSTDASQAFDGTATNPIVGSPGQGLTSAFPTSATSTTATDPLSGIIASLQPMITWLNDPARLFKLLAGLLLIGISIMMLVAPDAVNFIKKNPELLAA